MHRFRRYIRHLQLHYEALSLPLVDQFKVTLPDAPCDVPLVFDTDTTPSPRSVVATLSLDEMQCLRKFYFILYPLRAN